jgi:hypothetical protein
MTPPWPHYAVMFEEAALFFGFWIPYQFVNKEVQFLALGLKY